MLYNNILPPQQILQANGKQSIDNLRMSPNSSVLIADQTAPIVWKCVSDGLGNVTAEAFDISPHKDEKQIEHENTLALLNDMNERLKRLESCYESTTKRNRNDAEISTSKNNASGNKRSANTLDEQS